MEHKGNVHSSIRRTFPVTLYAFFWERNVNVLLWSFCQAMGTLFKYFFRKEKNSSSDYDYFFIINIFYTCYTNFFLISSGAIAFLLFLK